MFNTKLANIWCKTKCHNHIEDQARMWESTSQIKIYAELIEHCFHFGKHSKYVRIYYDFFAFRHCIAETDDGEFVFQYDKNFVKEHPAAFITFTMPVTDKPYTDKRLFPFFEGLIPEGWLLDIASKNWKIDKHDRMGLLLACCQKMRLNE